MTASEWKLASQDPILSLLMKKLDGNNLYNLKSRLACEIDFFQIIFSPQRSEFAYVYFSFELAFELKLIVFVNKLGCKQS